MTVFIKSKCLRIFFCSNRPCTLDLALVIWNQVSRLPDQVYKWLKQMKMERISARYKEIIENFRNIFDNPNYLCSSRSVISSSFPTIAIPEQTLNNIDWTLSSYFRLRSLALPGNNFSHPIKRVLNIWSNQINFRSTGRDCWWLGQWGQCLQEEYLVLKLNLPPHHLQFFEFVMDV